MVAKMVERKEREIQAVKSPRDSGKVSDDALFSKASNLIKVEKK